MKKYIIILAMLLFSSGLFAQGVYNNGAKIVISSGVTLYVGGNYQNETNGSDGSIDLSGTVKLAGNYTNNVAAADAIGTAAPGSKLELIGTAAQTIGGTTSATFTFPDLIINNSAGVVISKNSKVTGALTFTNGLVNIGSSNLTFGPTASVAGTPSASTMIVATGAGEVRKEYSGIGFFSFPVGDNTNSPEYSPVSLDLINGSFDAGAYIGVNLVNDKYNNPAITGSYLNRYWNITQTGISGFSCSAVFYYNPLDVVGQESDLYCVKVDPTTLTVFYLADIFNHVLSAQFSSFGTFTGAIGQRTLNLTVFLEGLYNGGSIMRKSQGDLGDQYLGTTADQVTVELHSAVTGQYTSIDYFTPLPINLSTSGLATVIIPGIHNGSYYLTVKHRNSIETVSADPVSFASGIINYNFTTSATQAFGSNMKDMGGVFAIYSGDVNVDGIVDGTDMASSENSSNAITLGYVPQDVNGDGIVDGSDMAIIENNSNAIVYLMTP